MLKVNTDYIFLSMYSSNIYMSLHELYMNRKADLNCMKLEPVTSESCVIVLTRCTENRPKNMHAKAFQDVRL